MRQIEKWTARRPGGRITIQGLEKGEGEEVGHPVKIVGVDTIEANPGGAGPIATDKYGNRYVLV